MARPIEIKWPTPDNAAICALQMTAGAGNLLINGDLATTGNFPAYVSLPNIFRTISVTSTGDLSSLTFTIAGTTLDGLVASQTITGPHGNTVQTTLGFTTITSVSVSGAVGTNVSVGTGTTGTTAPILWNYHATGNPALGIQVGIAGTINYSFLCTLNDLSVGNVATSFTPITAMTAATANQLAVFNIPVRYYYLLVNSSGTDGTLDAVFIQQGIT